ncbi:PIN2/TERF1-interacting telomerase inhibitor 1 [Bicyclus anynana]|uniref:PIN2/TERF1-interacting telomerase inhibitor 1 n=1 Tax=Bicyclus anynana TaxID=110368 RepID=A0A6J1NQ44_BICAN|nr:PIN2/TERF1-interacting telomerase inhibitor 1 [Bicyclus anynana]
MSMLAEPRRKQKVINLRAKNNAWSNDSNKFGQRMLEKMGWSSGKGLGAKENGIVEHVVARYKNDEKGLGFEDRNDQWTKNEDDFNTLLANLSNGNTNNETLHSGISLEKKSKKSKARIHYHKFTRGKDLSRYSEKDLANIFGKKSFKESVTDECIKEDTVKTTEQIFTEKGNMDDYFKSKMAAFKSKSNLCNNTTENEESDYAFQGFSNSDNQESESNQNGCNLFSFYSSQNENLSQNVELSYPDIESKNKKKKKSKQKDISSDIVLKQDVIPEGTEVTENKLKKSKKKNRQNVTDDIQPLGKVEESTQELPQEIATDIERTKVKKSKKKNGYVIDDIHPLDKVQKSNSTEGSQELLQEIVTDIEQTKVKKSKKKKQKEYVENKIEPCGETRKLKKNINHVEDDDEGISIEDIFPSKKKKRKNKDL